MSVADVAAANHCVGSFVAVVRALNEHSNLLAVRVFVESNTVEHISNLLLGRLCHNTSFCLIHLANNI